MEGEVMQVFGNSGLLKFSHTFVAWAWVYK